MPDAFYAMCPLSGLSPISGKGREFGLDGDTERQILKSMALTYVSIILSPVSSYPPRWMHQHSHDYPTIVPLGGQMMLMTRCQIYLLG